MPARKKRPVATPLPNLHFWMVLATVVLMLAAMIMYAVVSPNKEAVYVVVISACIGFLFGKGTNGFGKTPSLHPTVDTYDHDHDGIPDSEQGGAQQ